MGEGGYRQINKSLNICAFDDYLSVQHKVLPKLADVEQIAPSVTRVLGQNPGKFTLQGTNTYLVGTGRSRLLIDTGQGIPQWADLIRDTLDKLDVSLSHVLLTHWHGDHAKGVPDLIRMYPHLVDAIYKHTPEHGQRAIEDGQLFEIEGATIRAVHSPGHSHDHVSFVLDGHGMFTGDNVLGHGTSAVEELSIYMNSLRRMDTFGCVLGFPAHGAVIPNLHVKITSELAQKARREKQVLTRLGLLKQEAREVSGRQIASVTVKELVLAMHGDAIDEEVRELALEPFVDEILRKLAKDNKVAFEKRKGVKRWFALD